MNIESGEQNKVEIMPFAADDMQAVIDLRLEARRSEPGVFPRSHEEEAATTPEEWEERFSKVLGPAAKDILLLAKSGKRLDGMLGAREVGAGKWDFHGVFVRPEARGKHIGEQLVRSALEKIRARPDAALVTFMANADQEAALKLYEKAGFQVVGTSRAVMGDGKEHDKVILKLDLA